MKGGEIAGERVCAAGSPYPLLGEMPINVGLRCGGESGGENKKKSGDEIMDPHDLSCLSPTSASAGLVGGERSMALKLLPQLHFCSLH